MGYMKESQLARVVKIISPSVLVINQGAQDGITDLSQFVVFTYDEEIIDPETQESLGRLENVRGRGKVKHLQDRITTIISTMKRKEQSWGQGFVAGFGPPVMVDVLVPFQEPQVGDLVRVL